MTTALFSHPPVCFSCGKSLSCIAYDFEKAKIKATGSSIYHIPLRSIDDKQFQEGKKSFEGKILDDLGVFRICCRIILLNQPKNQVPIKYWDENTTEKEEKKETKN